MDASAFDRAGCEPGNDPFLEHHDEDDQEDGDRDQSRGDPANGTWNWALPVKNAIDADTGRRTAVLLSVIDNRGSFQAVWHFASRSCPRGASQSGYEPALFGLGASR